MAATSIGRDAIRGGRSASEPSANLRRKSSLVTRNEGRPRPPKRGSSAMSLRAISVSTGPSESTPRIERILARVTGCS